MHICPGRKFTHTAYKEKIQINISSGSSLFFLLLSANTQPFPWDSDGKHRCAVVYVRAIWLCGAWTNLYCISCIIDIAYFFLFLFLQLTIYLIYLRSISYLILFISVITDYIRSIIMIYHSIWYISSSASFFLFCCLLPPFWKALSLIGFLSLII